MRRPPAVLVAILAAAMAAVFAAPGVSPADTGDNVSGAIDPKDFGAIGDGEADDTAALQAMGSALRPGRTANLGSGLYRISAPVRASPGVTYQGGTIIWTIATPLRGAFIAADDAAFVGIHFIGSGATGTASAPLYQIAIDSGATSRGGLPANRVTVQDCVFEKMTVGVFVGGDSADATPVGWRIAGNLFRNIVGYVGPVTANGGTPGQSEGYGALFSPASDGEISGNRFINVRRHAIYLAGGAQRDVVDGNMIDGVDNVAITLNTFLSQPNTENIRISRNKIKNLTRSAPYGYLSSVGIGVYGKFSNVDISGNTIVGALDTGIHIDATAAGDVIYGHDVKLSDNNIEMAPNSTDSAIRLDEVDGADVSANRVGLAANNYGVAATSRAGNGRKPLIVVGNNFETRDPSAVLARVDFSAPRILRVRGNVANGFLQNNLLRDTSTARDKDVFFSQ
jgi:Right handed beta helix region